MGAPPNGRSVRSSTHCTISRVRTGSALERGNPLVPARRKRERKGASPTPYRQLDPGRADTEGSLGQTRIGLARRRAEEGGGADGEARPQELSTRLAHRPTLVRGGIEGEERSLHGVPVEIAADEDNARPPVVVGP